MSQPITRRGFLGAVSVGAAVACSDVSEDTAADNNANASDDAPEPGEYRESPMLAERVAAGELPSLEERLPAEPYIVQPGLLVESKFLDMQPGRHGGRLELAQSTPTSSSSIFLGNVEPVLWATNGFDFDARIEGNVLAGYEANTDDTVFTFHMRKGLKWSDGEPVKIEDVQFAFEDVLLNEDITLAFPYYLRAGRRADRAPAELEIVDDLTFSLHFAEPYGTFPAQVAIAQWRSYSDIIKPRHYLEQFHQKYANPAELQELLAEASLADDRWFDLFNEKQWTGVLNLSNAKVGHPTLTPWIMTRAETGVFRYERNPYYFKVDAQGNQLPYIDELRAQVVQDMETLTSRALFGEFDYLGQFGALRQLSLISERAERGEVKMYLPRYHVLPTAFVLNQSHPDQIWRDVVRDIDFRRALNLAINRQEIVETFYLGEFARPAEESNPGEYDREEANRLLDGMGLVQRDEDGFRLGPDGERFRIPLEMADRSEDHIPIAELLAEYWNDIGIFTTVRQVDRGTLAERNDRYDIKATGIWVHKPIWPTGASWPDYIPDWWEPAWRDWWESGGEIGDEPPSEMKELFELHTRFMAARVGSEEFRATAAAILQNHYDNIWLFNPVEHYYYPTFWSSRVHNVPEGVKDENFGVLANFGMEQWYIDEDG